MNNGFAELKGYEPEVTRDFTPGEIEGDKPQSVISATYPNDDMQTVEAREEGKKPTVFVKVEVDASELDAVYEKANQLKAVLEEVNDLIGSLAVKQSTEG